MRQQHVPKNEQQSKPTIIDTQTRRVSQDRPVRTVIYIEVGGMNQAMCRELATQFAAQYEGFAVGTHYIVPVRNGKINTDVEFESEFLEMVKKVCEVRDGEIVLKDGAADVKILRQHVSGDDQ